MLSFTDEALILTIYKLGDSDAIVHLLTREHGVYRGVIKRAFSGKGRADIQVATQVEAVWKARLAEHLGTVTLEAKHSFGARVMHDPLRLAAVGSVMSMIAVSLGEHEAHPQLYAQVVAFLQHVAAGVEPLVWLGEYVRLELALLEQAGYGLDLSSCAATGVTEDLVYVSPKSGRAVSAVAGQPYHDRMLALPEFIRTDHLPMEMAEIKQGVSLAGHFFETHLLPALHRQVPPLRSHFADLLGRMAG